MGKAFFGLCGEAKPKHLTKPGARSSNAPASEDALPTSSGSAPSSSPPEVEIVTPVKAMPDAGMREIMKKRKELQKLEV